MFKRQYFSSLTKTVEALKDIVSKESIDAPLKPKVITPAEVAARFFPNDPQRHRLLTRRLAALRLQTGRTQFGKEEKNVDVDSVKLKKQLSPRIKEALSRRLMDPIYFTERMQDLMKRHLWEDAYAWFVGALELKTWRPQDLDPVLMNVMISGFVENGEFKKAFDIYNMLKKRGIKPTTRTFVLLMGTCRYKPNGSDGILKLNLTSRSFQDENMEENEEIAAKRKMIHSARRCACNALLLAVECVWRREQLKTNPRTDEEKENGCQPQEHLRNALVLALIENGAYEAALTLMPLPTQCPLLISKADPLWTLQGLLAEAWSNADQVWLTHASEAWSCTSDKGMGAIAAQRLLRSLNVYVPPQRHFEDPFVTTLQLKLLESCHASLEQLQSYRRNRLIECHGTLPDLKTRVSNWNSAVQVQWIKSLRLALTRSLDSLFSESQSKGKKRLDRDENGMKDTIRLGHIHAALDGLQIPTVTTSVLWQSRGECTVRRKETDYLSIRDALLYHRFMDHLSLIRSLDTRVLTILLSLLQDARFTVLAVQVFLKCPVTNCSIYVNTCVRILSQHPALAAYAHRIRGNECLASLPLPKGISSRDLESWIEKARPILINK